MASPDPFTEREWVTRLQSGDEQAFNLLYQAYAGRLFGVIIKLVKSDIIAGDILQDVFLKLWESRAGLDDGKSFRSYLFRMTENKVYDFFRTAARDKKMKERLLGDFREGHASFEEGRLEGEDTHILREAIDQLPPRRKEVYILCKLEGKTYEEVSRQLGISTSTISDHIVKATLAIREYLYNRPGMSAWIFLWCLSQRL